MARNRTVRRIPADLAIIARDVGSLLAMESGMMAATVGVAAVFAEWYGAVAFLLAAVVTAAVGLGARRVFADAPDPRMKHGMIIAAAGWFCVAVFGAIPFLLMAYLTPTAVMASYVPSPGAETYEAVTVFGATSRSSLVYFRHPLHAFFESMSGWTGSGLTMAVHEPTLPRTVQWWRSFMQWVGGVGVIVLTTAILARPGSGSYALYRSEAREEKIHPSIISTVRTVWKIFVLYTALAVLAMFVAISLSDYGSQLPTWRAFWQALNHAMTGLSTGGFSVTDNSIGTYDSPLIETVLLPIMALGAIAFPIHYVVLSERDAEPLWDDLQTRWLLLLFGVGVLVLSVQNAAALTTAFEATNYVGLQTVGLSAAQTTAVRDSVFQWISALSCTGFQSSPIGGWKSGGKLMLSVAMVIGGAAGSTVGGIKIIRAYTIGRGIVWQFSRVFLPSSAVVTAEINGRSLGRNEMEREFSEAAIVSMLWLTLLVASSLVMVNVVGPEFGLADALFEVASAQGNVGLSTGITGPGMHPLAEGMFVLNMWVGRLEIIPVLVFARSIVYGLNPR
ncbi:MULTISPECIES: TrkH family potassium uptake protein [Halorussus]|uniref:TrkH family potassium uptake protein n=1 Tax=Halorussus TaxID=1070314 RepID=UPI000E2137E6|nr:MULTISPECIES: TrkH family potassium uptake protein [Halorussus]NHN59648.1 TrkH family potassium uptake protein [Halorussus sp. JP-T4]